MKDKNSKPIICVIDNEATMQREAWADGELRAAVSSRMLFDEAFMESGRLDFRLNVGPWKLGKLHYGDKAAMEFHMEEHNAG